MWVTQSVKDTLKPQMECEFYSSQINFWHSTKIQGTLENYSMPTLIN